MKLVERRTENFHGNRQVAFLNFSVNQRSQELDQQNEGKKVPIIKNLKE